MNIAPHQYIGNIESCQLVYPGTASPVQPFVCLTSGRGEPFPTEGRAAMEPGGERGRETLTGARRDCG